MPASYAHIFFGNTVYHHLPQELQQSIGREKALFEIGLQGPDVLLFYRSLRPNPVAAAGVRMQEESGREWFGRACRELARQKGDYELTEGSKAYIDGVLCYFVLNARCRAYCDQYAESHGVSVEEIESEFDRSLMERKQQDPVSANPIPGFHPTPRAASIAALFYPGIGVERMEKAMRSFVLTKQAARYGAAARNQALAAGDKLLQACGQLAGQQNSIPSSLQERAASRLVSFDLRYQESNKALLRLLREAVPEAVRLIENFDAEEVQNDPIFACHFNGRSVTAEESAT